MFENKKIFNLRNAAFVLFFIALAASADNIPVAALWGKSGQTFTLFQILGPLPGFFLGPVFGVLSVLGAEIINFILLGKTVEVVNLMRFLPMLGAAYFFATYGKNKSSLVIPVMAIIFFNLNPIGRQAWVFSLFWLVPILCAFFFPRSLFFKALGATFVAHSIGGAFWGYLVPMTPEMWLSLIPIVIVERLAFAIGITISFVALNSLLNHLFAESKTEYELLNIEKQISIF